nr:MAG TPA: replisome organizer [Caudoviricetes sp.]
MYSPRCWRRNGTVERANVLSLLGRLKQAYPQAYAKMTRAEAEELVSLWSDMLDGEDPAEAMDAVNALIAEDTRGFPPKVGQVLAKIRGAASPHISVAWMKPYIEQIAEQEAFMPSISRYAREHGMTWEAAAAEMEGDAWSE